jgi:hypothetical protein
MYKGEKLQHQNSLPWNLPPSMVKDLMAYVVSRINMKQSIAINKTVTHQGPEVYPVLHCILVIMPMNELWSLLEARMLF